MNTAFGGPVLTEIHYNGTTNGIDPDEFLELTNPENFTLDLSGWQFTRGIDYSFRDGQTLAPATSLLIARDPSGFRAVFPNYQGIILNFSGALSNSGEALTLVDQAGAEVWSLRYDDRAPWPQSADGLGDSLQLIQNAFNPSIASNWEAKIPSPGTWGPLAPAPIAVPTPTTLSLVAAGVLALTGRRKTQCPTAN